MISPWHSSKFVFSFAYVLMFLPAFLFALVGFLSGWSIFLFQYFEFAGLCLGGFITSVGLNPVVRLIPQYRSSLLLSGFSVLGLVGLLLTISVADSFTQGLEFLMIGLFVSAVCLVLTLRLIESYLVFVCVFTSNVVIAYTLGADGFGPFISSSFIAMMPTWQYGLLGLVLLVFYARQQWTDGAGGTGFGAIILRSGSDTANPKCEPKTGNRWRKVGASMFNTMGLTIVPAIISTQTVVIEIAAYNEMMSEKSYMIIASYFLIGTAVIPIRAEAFDKLWLLGCYSSKRFLLLSAALYLTSAILLVVITGFVYIHFRLPEGLTDLGAIVDTLVFFLFFISVTLLKLHRSMALIVLVTLGGFLVIRGDFIGDLILIMSVLVFWGFSVWYYVNGYGLRSGRLSSPGFES